MLESLMFFMIETRLDIAFTTSVTSRYTKNLNHFYIEVKKIILRYLKGSKDQDIVYRGGTLNIKDYSNLDWVGDKENK